MCITYPSLPQKVILYNPISGHGHLDSWHAMFATLLAERGYDVTCLTTDQDSLRTHLALYECTQRARINVQLITWCPMGFWDAVRCRALIAVHWWRIFSDRYVKMTGDALILEHMLPLVRVKKMVFKWTVPTLRRLVGNLSVLEQWCGYLARFNGHIVTAIEETKCTPVMVLHMYLDCEDHAFTKVPEFLFPWAGVSFAPSGVASETCYAMPSFRGMALCYEYAEEVHKGKHPQKQFVTLPDIANATLPKNVLPLVEELLDRAAGRTIVFMGGSIGVQKNISAWKACIEQMNPQDWFFVQVGEIHFDSMDQSSAHAMHTLLGSPPENFFAFAEYLADESHFNAVIAASDILFAAYKDFLVSSNMLGKAAAFEKPLLVSEGHVMARRVRQYKLGLVAPQDDVQSIIAALETLREHPRDPCGFAAYRADYSMEKLGDTLDDFLKRCIRQ